MSSHGKLIDKIHVDQAVPPKSLASTSETGEYFSTAGVDKVAFHIGTGAIAAGKTVVAQVLKAKDAKGTGSADLADAKLTLTANEKVKKALLTANTIADGDSTVTVNGVTYACADSDPDIGAGEFASGANDTEACANLASAINHLQGDSLVATPSGATVVLSAKEPGRTPITLSGTDPTIIPSTLEAQGKLEVSASDLGGEYSHVALKLTTDDTITAMSTLVREGGYYSPSP